jgi:hypothetical protein
LRQTIQNSESPGQIYQVMTWQNGHGLYQESLEWTERLPLSLRSLADSLGRKRSTVGTAAMG